MERYYKLSVYIGCRIYNSDNGLEDEFSSDYELQRSAAGPPGKTFPAKLAKRNPVYIR
jgi:hypothetical protein